MNLRIKLKGLIMTLIEAVQTKNVQEGVIQNAKVDCENIIDNAIIIIKECDRLIDLNKIDLNIDRIQIAEAVIKVIGDPYGETLNVKNGENTIAIKALNDIAQNNTCVILRDNHIANIVTEENKYIEQIIPITEDLSNYNIQDMISLVDPADYSNITGSDKVECIYYLTNYYKVFQVEYESKKNKDKYKKYKIK